MLQLQLLVSSTTYAHLLVNLQIYTDLVGGIQNLIEKSSRSKIMNKSKIYIVPLILMITVTSLSSCSYHPNSETAARSETSTPSNTKLLPTPSMAQLRAKKSSTTSPTTEKTINVTLYISDTECQTLTPKEVSVSATEPVTSAVGKILEQRDSADFSLSGYRVTTKNGVAIIDLRLSPYSPRHLTSLSNCEQFALFGSLRKTLTSNPQWKIKEVRFTELGKEILV